MIPALSLTRSKIDFFTSSSPIIFFHLYICAPTDSPNLIQLFPADRREQLRVNPSCTLHNHLQVIHLQLRRNSTLYGSADSYWGQFDEVTKYNVHLNVAERLWAAWYAYMQNDVLATGIMSFVMHEVVYFGRSLPWFIIDKIPYFNKYKIQNVSCLNSLHLF
jgi:hypothetical protein